MSARRRPANRQVIQITKVLHDRLKQVQAERLEELGRSPSFAEIIEGWRKAAEKVSA